MKLRLSKQELSIIKFWYLSCSDKSLETWGEFCNKCPLKEQCEILKKKLNFK